MYIRYNFTSTKLVRDVLQVIMQWGTGLDRRPLNREVLGSKPTDAVSNLGHVRYPTLSLGMLPVHPKRMTGVKPKEASCKDKLHLITHKYYCMMHFSYFFQVFLACI